MAISVVQTQSAGGATSGTSIVITPSASYTANNGVILGVGWEDTSITISSLSGGGTWTAASSKLDHASENRSIQLYLLKLASAAASTTISFSGSASRISCSLAEFSGHDSAADAEAVGSANIQTAMAATTDAVTASVTSLTDGALIFGWSYVTLANGITQLNGGTGMTACPVLPGNPARGRGVYFDGGTAGSKTALWTCAGGTNESLISVAVALKAAASGGGGGVIAVPPPAKLFARRVVGRR